MKFGALIIPLLAVALAGGIAVALPAPTHAGAAVPRPRIISISPPAGLPAGGGPLTIDGTGLGGVTKVKFGASNTTRITYRSATRLRVRTPAHHAATVSVHAFAPSGRSATTSAARYVYASAPKPLTWSAASSLYSRTHVLIDVSCSGTDFCLAIDNSGAYEYDGTSWSPRTTLVTAKPAPYGPPQLTHVSCTSPTFCVAVGSGDGAFSYTWDGSGWSAEMPISARPVTEPEISCAPGTSACVAVSGGADLYVLHAGQWTPVPAGSKTYPELVACATPDYCLVNDDHVFDGTAVHALGSSAPLDVVSRTACASATFCVAMDPYGSASVFDGSSWSEPSKRPPHFATSSLSCPSPTFCYAFDRGQDTRSGISNGISFDGTSWSAKQLVDADAGVIAGSCGTARNCVAVDDAVRSLRLTGGGWGTPVRIAADHGALTDVSCASATLCMAVDHSGNALRYDGNGWSAPHQIDHHRILTDVSCPTASFCAAIDVSTLRGGSPEVRRGGYAVVWRGTGSGWSQPSRVDASTNLTSLSCGSANLCFATDNNGQVYRFDGSRWSGPTQLEPPAPGFSVVGSVSCASARFCLAVYRLGSGQTGNSGVHEHVWDGSHWGTTRSYPELRHTQGPVACGSASFCAVYAGFAGTVMRHDTTTGYGVRVFQVISMTCVGQAFCLATTRSVDEDRPDYHPSFTFDGSAYGPARMPLSGGSVSCAPNETCAVVRGTSAAVGTR